MSTGGVHLTDTAFARQREFEPGTAPPDAFKFDTLSKLANGGQSIANTFNLSNIAAKLGGNKSSNSESE